MVEANTHEEVEQTQEFTLKDHTEYVKSDRYQRLSKIFLILGTAFFAATIVYVGPNSADITFGASVADYGKTLEHIKEITPEMAHGIVNHLIDLGFEGRRAIGMSSLSFGSAFLSLGAIMRAKSRQ